jgi:hypothetical protein
MPCARRRLDPVIIRSAERRPVFGARLTPLAGATDKYAAQPTASTSQRTNSTHRRTVEEEQRTDVQQHRVFLLAERTGVA